MITSADAGNLKCPPDVLSLKNRKEQKNIGDPECYFIIKP